MESLGLYGKLIREYEGDGFITLDSSQTCKCSIKAVQLTDGKVMASCIVTDNQASLFKCINNDDEVKSIRGITKENDELIIEGNILITYFNFSDMVVLANSMMTKKNAIGELESVRFGMTNFEFLGNNWKEYSDGSGGRDILLINLLDRKIEIHVIQDYKLIMQSIKAQKGIDVTSEAIINVNSKHDLNSIIRVVDTLCKLLSLARGTKINWIYYDGYDANGDKILSYHKNSVNRQYTSLSVIDPRNPNETASFIEEVYNNYLNRENLYGLDKAIEAYLDAKIEAVYLESRALKAVVVLEFLKGKYAKTNKVEMILPGCHFKKVIRNIKSLLKQQFENMSLSQNRLEEMNTRMAELNRKSFGVILDAMFTDLDVKITEDELSRLIKVRNSLIHRASFVTKDYWQEYTLLISILDRIFLKILDYNGVYLDITNKSERVFNDT
ncbi:hypothetical protein KA005_40070 [bacterium]|nr:hypothetical protein [bacterium]